MNETVKKLWELARDDVRAEIRKRAYDACVLGRHQHDVQLFGYYHLFKLAVTKMAEHDVPDLYCRAFEPKSITEVNDGHYQGTILFLVPTATYQPSLSDYWVTSVGYGSCSFCDTMQSIEGQVPYDGSDDEKLIESLTTDLFKLTSDMVVSLKKLTA